MTKTGVGDVADKDPTDLKHTLPLVGRPDCTATSVVDLWKGPSVKLVYLIFYPYLPGSTSQPYRRNDRCEVSTSVSEALVFALCRKPCVDTEEEVDRSPPGSLLECFVQPLVPGVRGAPNLVFQGLVHVVLCVGFDDKEPSLCKQSVNQIYQTQ